jgi:hypothetical protein
MTPTCLLLECLLVRHSKELVDWCTYVRAGGSIGDWSSGSRSTFRERIANLLKLMLKLLNLLIYILNSPPKTPIMYLPLYSLLYTSLLLPRLPFLLTQLLPIPTQPIIITSSCQSKIAINLEVSHSNIGSTYISFS